MNRTRAMHLPQWRQMASGFAVAVFALVFLCSTTQAHAHQSPTGKAATDHLSHLVVASHNPALLVAGSDKPSSDTYNGSLDSLARLLAAVLWLNTGTDLPSDHATGQRPNSRLHYRTPPLRAPPIA